VDEAT
jgi:hypothetical protein